MGLKFWLITACGWFLLSLLLALQILGPMDYVIRLGLWGFICAFWFRKEGA